MKKLVLMKSELEYLKESINNRVRLLNKRLKKQYKNVFLLMNILVMISIVMNFGAIFLTNMLVMKANPNVEIVEANPVQSKVHGLEAADMQRSVSLIFMLMFNAAIWAIFLFLYWYSMQWVHTRKQMYWALVIVLFYFVVLSVDFFNDFGFFIGKLVYGG